MQIANTLYITDPADWRAWLEQHHADETELWLVFYKQETGRPNIPLAAAIEEALCYGWIDSIIQKIDGERYARKFTPRVNNRKWSALNLRRARKLIDAGRMTPAGLARIDPALLSGELQPHQRPAALEVPAFVEQALQANPPAWENFNRMAPSQRRNYIGWIMDAKKEETRCKRLLEAIDRLKQNLSLGLK